MTSDEDDPEVLGEVLALLAHDLKNPLAAVVTNVSFAQSQLDPVGNEDVRDALEDARQACDSLQRFIANFESIARDIAFRLAQEPPATPLDVTVIADDASTRVGFHAVSRRQVVKVHRPSAPLYAKADRDLVVRVLDNLIMNSLQYAPTGSVIDVHVARDGSNARISVLDDGIIVPPDLRDVAVTRRGQLAAKSRLESRYGRGLGLLVASIAARAANGRLEVGEENGRSALSLFVPLFESG